jgi:hypothetical protein
MRIDSFWFVQQTLFGERGIPESRSGHQRRFNWHHQTWISKKRRAETTFPDHELCLISSNCKRGFLGGNCSLFPQLILNTVYAQGVIITSRMRGIDLLSFGLISYLNDAFAKEMKNRQGAVSSASDTVCGAAEVHKG